MDKFQQLVADLDSGDLGILHLQNALRQHFRRSPVIPDEVRSLLCGEGEKNAGLIAQHFALLRTTIGNFELAVRRAKD